MNAKDAMAGRPSQDKSAYNNADQLWHGLLQICVFVIVQGEWKSHETDDPHQLSRAMLMSIIDNKLNKPRFICWTDHGHAHVYIDGM